MSMEFSTAITGFDKNYNLNTIGEYNNFLKGSASFEFDNEVTDFERTLDNAYNTQPIKDKHDPSGLGSFMNNIGNAFSNGLNAVNDSRILADKMQEDVATGGPTSIHEAMIAAEKATLNMQMAIQVRNRIISAYTEMTQMAM